MLAALYGDGDREAGMRALESLEEQAVPDTEPLQWSPALCTVWQWRVWNGRPDGLREAIERLRGLDVRGATTETPAVCADVLETVDTALRNRPGARALLVRLDSILVTGPQVWYTNVQLPGNLSSARLHLLFGNPAEALAAVRRRTYDVDSTHLLLATSLRLEAELAAQMGETAAARRAYEHYLLLRRDPEPELQAQSIPCVRRSLRCRCH